MRVAVALAVVIAATGCESKGAPTPPATTGSSANRPAHAPIVDLTGATALGPVRTAFNAHKGEVRFLTLLAPT
jgi:hypothetical protein